MATLNQLLIAEATEYEFKSIIEANKPRSWLKTVSAFANGVGGSIYFGVSDDAVAIGLDNPQKAAEQISELIKARIEPAIKNFVLEPIRVDGKDILRLRISGGESTPYYYTGDGNKLAFYRIGNESAPTPAAVLNELLLKGLHQTFDVLELNINTRIIVIHFSRQRTNKRLVLPLKDRGIIARLGSCQVMIL
jgi:ATP-dependent DNA helicase RecG